MKTGHFSNTKFLPKLPILAPILLYLMLKVVLKKLINKKVQII